MSKADLLQRVIDDVSHKDLGKARERLRCYLVGNPNDLGVRHILGRVYLLLQYPREAGRFLYLVDDDSDDVQKAVRAFEKSCAGNPDYILHHLKLRGSADSLVNEYAKNKLSALIQKAGKNWLVTLGEPQVKKHHTAKGSNDWVGAVLGIGCLIFVAASFIFGIIHVVKYLWNVISGLFG